MLRVGLTGSIATGKSTVLGMMNAHDIHTISSDDIVHRLYEGAAVAPVEALFPGVTTEGRIDRRALAAHLFAAPEQTAALEAIVHPMVRARIAAFFDEAEARGAPLAVAEIPLLFEGAHDYGLDAVVVVTVDDAIQRERALARPGMNVEKLDAILARQMPQSEKKRHATYVVDTSASLAATGDAITAVVGDLLANQQAQ